MGVSGGMPGGVFGRTLGGVFGGNCGTVAGGWVGATKGGCSGVPGVICDTGALELACGGETGSHGYTSSVCVAGGIDNGTGTGKDRGTNSIGAGGKSVVIADPTGKVTGMDVSTSGFTRVDGGGVLTGCPVDPMPPLPAPPAPPALPPEPPTSSPPPVPPP